MHTKNLKLRQALWMWGIAAFVVFYQFMLQASTSVMVPELMTVFSIDASHIGWLASLYYYLYVFLQMPAGTLLDRLGARKLLTTAGIVLFFCCLLFAFAPNFYIAALARTLMGVAAAPAFVATLCIVAQNFSPRYFALLTGCTEMMGMLGGAIGIPLLGLLMHHNPLGWQGVMITCGLIGLLCATLCYFVLKHCAPSKIASTSMMKNQEKSNKKMWNYILKKPFSWWIGIYSGLAFSVVATFAALWCVPFLQSVYQFSLPMATFGAGLIFVGTAIGAPFIGWCADRFGGKRFMMLVTSGVTAILLIILIYVPNLPLPLLFLLLGANGFFSTGYMLPFAVMRDAMPREMQGTAMGYVNMMCIIIPALFLQPLVGILLRFHQHATFVFNKTVAFTTEDFHFALAILPIAMLLGFIVACIFRQPSRRLSDPLDVEPLNTESDYAKSKFSFNQ